MRAVHRNMSNKDMSRHKTDVPYGTLELLILKTLDSMGDLHGYALARRIEQISESQLRLSQGAIYPALIRLEQQGLIETEWGMSATNRRVKTYSLTRVGKKQVRVETAKWERAAVLVAKFIGVKP